MSYSQPYEEGKGRVPREKIEAAMEEVAEHRREFLRDVQGSGAPSENLLRSFHAAVLTYYSELRNYREWDVLQKKWGTAKMWPADGDGGLGRVTLEPGVHVRWKATGEPELTDAGKKKVNNQDWVRGVDTLSEWINRTRTVEQESAGLGRGGRTVEIPEHLPPMRLLRASYVLDAVARELGVAISEDSGRRPVGLLDNEGLSEAAREHAEENDMEIPDEYQEA